MVNQIPIQLKNMRFNRVRFKEKRAFESGWQNKPYSYSEIQNYFPKENYGVICGPEVRVLDDDTPDKRLIKLFLEKFGETFRVRDHLYFKFDNGNEDKIILFDGEEHAGEVQGNNTYVVGPGCIHPSGEEYKQMNDLEIITINFASFKFEFEKYFKTTEKTRIRDEPTYRFEDDELIKQIKSKWNEGDRQNLTLSLSGYLRKDRKLGLNSALQVIEQICEDCNDNDFYERKRAVEETYSKDESEIKGITGLIEREIEVKKFSINDFLIFRKNKRTGDEEFDRVNIDAVAEYIENNFQIRTIFGIREETIEVYNDGIWTVKGRGIIKAEIERILGVYCKNNTVSEILEKIKRRTEVSREDTEIIPDKKRALKNGVLDFEDVDNIKLIPHSKEYNFRTKWDINYNPESKCTKFKEIIDKALDQDDIPKFQEWEGLHISRKYSKKKFAILHGKKDTTKTVAMNHLTIVQNNNVSGLTLQDIARGKPFDLLVLKDKDANICDDLSSSDMKAIGGVKKSVGDGFIDGEMKFGDKIRFPNTAKQTYACNKIPNPGEDIDDEAYYGRILLFAFENVIPENKQDPDLIKKITTDEEKSGWLNWAIEGYIRLMKNNKFTRDLSPEETKYFMIKNGNSLAEFSIEVLKEDAGKKINKDDLYKVYCKWCSEHKPKLSPDSKDKIGKNLIKFAPFIQASSNGKERYWLNASFNDTYDTFLKNMRGFEKEVKEVKESNQNLSYVISKPVIPVIEKEEEKQIKPSTLNPFCPECNSPTYEYRDKFYCIDNNCAGGLRC